MTFLQGLLTARSHLAFLLGLGLSVAVVQAVGHGTKDPGPASGSARPADDFSLSLAVGDSPSLRATGVPLDDEQKKWARTAWRYFELNYQAETGLVNSADKYPSTTLWDLGSYMMGLLSAHDLGVIDDRIFGTRMRALLASLETLALVDGILPNKAYHTQTLGMVDYNNKELVGGLGWSALDVARIGVPFTITTWRHPELTPLVRRVIAAWKLPEAVHGGDLQGGERLPDGRLRRHQEGRFGYEEYAARSLFLLGLDTTRAARYDLDVAVATVSGQKIAYDARLPRDHEGTHNAVLSEPYVLQGLEMGFDRETLPLARAVFLAQEARFRETGILTAVSEDNLDRAPYFAYVSVLNDLKPWAAFTPDGKDANAFRTLSLKAALGWAVLFDGEYAQRLRAVIREGFDPERGFWSGRYEASGEWNKSITANTNGIVLEALAYQVKGPFMTAATAQLAKAPKAAPASSPKK